MPGRLAKRQNLPGTLEASPSIAIGVASTQTLSALPTGAPAETVGLTADWPVSETPKKVSNPDCVYGPCVPSVRSTAPGPPAAAPHTWLSVVPLPVESSLTP